MEYGGGRGGALTVRVLAPVLLVLGFALGLAYLAFDATRAQRAAARRTVTDFADFSAFIIANAAQQELERRLLYAFAGLRAWEPASGEPLPDPAILGRERTEAERCAASGIPEPTYARLDLRNGDLALAGSPIPDSAAHWLADTLAVEATTAYQPGWSFAHVISDWAGLGIVAYTVLRNDGRAVAAYAKTSCMAIAGTSVFRLAATTTTALPPSLTDGLPNDSLLNVRARDALGNVVHMTPSTWQSNVSGMAGPLPQLGNLTVVVDVRQDAADRLVVGGIPYGGAPMALLLLLLIAGFGVLAVVQVRRQEALLRARERFVSNVSHELRTPLQQILVFVELLRMGKLETRAERRHSVAVIERETRRLIQLVENVLTFARSERGDDALARVSVDLEPVVRETVQAFEPLADASGTEVRVVIDSASEATGDAGAIRRVLLNLLDNALKHGSGGQVVTVTVGRANGLATLTIDDEGPGIAAEQRSRVWEAFHRLDSDEPQASAGSGIGLAIVRDLVTGMHGEVRIEDAPGGGARFIVSLPSRNAP